MTKAPKEYNAQVADVQRAARGEMTYPELLEHCSFLSSIIGAMVLKWSPGLSSPLLRIPKTDFDKALDEHKLITYSGGPDYVTVLLQRIRTEEGR